MMGADQFYNVLVGKDLETEYRRAVEAAAWEYGHGGYTGTIAEKGGCVNLGPLPARMSAERLERLISEHQQWLYRKEAFDQGWNGAKKPGPNPVPEKWRTFVEKANAIYDDKWGPALVVEVTGSKAAEIKKRMGRAGTRDKVWVAMGWASS